MRGYLMAMGDQWKEWEKFISGDFLTVCKQSFPLFFKTRDDNFDVILKIKFVEKLFAWIFSLAIAAKIPENWSKSPLLDNVQM